jgi:uncharacterized membrane protein YdjX (TVP38/TMEM64 family)
MKKEQVIKILKVAIIATLIMLIFEAIFSIPQVLNFFKVLIFTSGNWFYLVIWIIMFLQCTILNIPAYVILSASTAIGVNTLSWQYILCVLSAYMVGCIFAYWLGARYGIKAIKWCAGSEEDFNKWSDFVNNKGKWFYFITVLFPFFPDDLLCLVCGSVKMNFGFYSIVNLFGRGVGLITMLFTLKLIGNIGGGFPFMIIVWAVALLVEFITLKVLEKRSK